MESGDAKCGAREAMTKSDRAAAPRAANVVRECAGTADRGAKRSRVGARCSRLQADAARRATRRAGKGLVDVIAGDRDVDRGRSLTAARLNSKSVNLSDRIAADVRDQMTAARRP